MMSVNVLSLKRSFKVFFIIYVTFYYIFKSCRSVIGYNEMSSVIFLENYILAETNNRIIRYRFIFCILPGLFI
jgi:hypothetical protein